MELYVERGFDETTVAEIAKRAGLTERTFFRHFADKREVLFAGAAMLQELFVGAVVDAPPDLAPVDAAMAGVVAGGALIQERPAFARQRYEIIAANAELQERELIKLASLSAALAGALRRRGVADHAASLAAEVAIAVFKIAFERWVSRPRPSRPAPAHARLTRRAPSGDRGQRDGATGRHERRKRSAPDSGGLRGRAAPGRRPAGSRCRRARRRHRRAGRHGR